MFGEVAATLTGRRGTFRRDNNFVYDLSDRFLSQESVRSVDSFEKTEQTTTLCAIYLIGFLAKILSAQLTVSKRQNLWFSSNQQPLLSSIKRYKKDQFFSLVLVCFV